MADGQYGRRIGFQSVRPSQLPRPSHPSRGGEACAAGGLVLARHAGRIDRLLGGAARHWGQRSSLLGRHEARRGGLFRSKAWRRSGFVRPAVSSWWSPQKTPQKTPAPGRTNPKAAGSSVGLNRKTLAYGRANPKTRGSGQSDSGRLARPQPSEPFRPTEPAADVAARVNPTTLELHFEAADHEPR